MLLATEAGVLALAVARRLVAGEAAGVRALERARPRCALAARVQASRAVPDSEIRRVTVGRMETPLLRSPLLAVGNPIVEAYRRAVLAALGQRRR